MGSTTAGSGRYATSISVERVLGEVAALRQRRWQPARRHSARARPPSASSRPRSSGPRPSAWSARRESRPVTIAATPGIAAAALVSIAEDIGMGVRRAQDRGVQRAGPVTEIVDETPAAGQQGGVLDALHGLTRPRDGFDLQRRSLPMTLLHTALLLGACREASIMSLPGAIPPGPATYRKVSNSRGRLSARGSARRGAPRCGTRSARPSNGRGRSG